LPRCHSVAKRVSVYTTSFFYCRACASIPRHQQRVAEQDYKNTDVETARLLDSFVFFLALKVEIDLQRIASAAIEKQSENARFKEFLRPIPTRQVDAAVAEINKQVSAAVDCTQCANCCRVLEPPVDKTEINRLAKSKQLSAKEFADSFVGEEASTSIEFLRCQPCIFLQANKCGIYNERPASCADYPHVHQPNFKYRWKSVMTNYTLCPIVFNVVESLKKEMNFR
jgi:uncharacterized protein